MKENRMFNLRPFVFIASSFCSGLLCMYAGLRAGLGAGFILVALWCAYILSFLFRRKRRTVLLLLAAFAALFSFFSSFLRVNAFCGADVPETVCSVDGRITRVEDYDGGTVRLILSDLSIGKEKKRFSLALYAPEDENFSVGKRISLSVKVENFGLFYENRLSAVNLVNGVKYRANVEEGRYYLYGGGQTLFEKAAAIIKDTLKAGLPEEEFSVAAALLTGEERYMDGDVLENFRNGGVAHIFAVSGLHIGFLAGVVFFLLRSCRVRGVPKVLISAAVLVFYAGICGFSPSSLRAAVMASVLAAAKESGMKYDGLSSLSISAIIVLAISPLQFFSVGFQLSYSVVFAVILLAPRIARAFRFLPQKVSSAVGVVLSAQIGGLPVSLFYFGNISFVSVAVNLIAVPFVSVVFVALITGVFVGAVFSVPVPALFVQKYLLKMLVGAVMLFDYEKLLLLGVSFGAFTLFYYALMILASGTICLKARTARLAAVVLACFFAGGAGICTARELSAVTMCVATDTAANSVCFSRGGKACLVLTDGGSGASFYNAKRFLERENVTSADLFILGENVYFAANYFIRYLDKVWYVSENGDAAADLFDAEFYRLSPSEAAETELGAFYLGSDGKTLVYENGARVLICGENADLSAYRGAYQLVVSPFDVGYIDAPCALFYPSYGCDDSYTAGNLLYKINASSVKRI